MINVIILNGPPRSGKTEIANFLNKVHDYRIYNFADILKEAQKAFFPLTEYEEFKKTELGSEFTGRDFIIKLAEEFIKPTLNRSFFANNVCDRITRNVVSGTRNVVIGDLGFDYEYETVYGRLIDLAKSLNTSIDIQVWHVVRNGTNFSNDSRTYIDVATNVVYNNGTLENLQLQVSSLVAST